MNFSHGHSGTKVRNVSFVLVFLKGKRPESTKMGEIHELFVLALFLVWFAGATPDLNAPYLNGLFSSGFQEVKRPLRTKLRKRPMEVGKRPIKGGERPITAMVLVGISVGCFRGCFRAPPPWRKTAPLKRPIKRSMIIRAIFPNYTPDNLFMLGESAASKIMHVRTVGGPENT